jgi:hypothetical protein
MDCRPASSDAGERLACYALQMGNFLFSVGAAAASLLVAVLSAVKGVWVVAAVFGMLVVGFLLRASEGRR